MWRSDDGSPSALGRLGRGFRLSVEEPSPGSMMVTLRGELDAATAYTFDAELRLVEERGPALVVLDLRELSFMDSTGLARLLAASRRASRGRWRLVLVRGPRTIQRVLALTGMAERFDQVADPATALATTRSPAGRG
jgi:anti-sigma B factor antagonist